jgi:hypothetical protein
MKLSHELCCKLVALEKTIKDITTNRNAGIESKIRKKLKLFVNPIRCMKRILRGRGSEIKLHANSVFEKTK